LSSDRDYHVVDHSLDHLVGSPSPLRCSLTDTDTVKWFQKLYTMMCFPDNHLGPDLVFFIRLPPNGRGLCVTVQAKFRSQSPLSKSDYNDVSTLIVPEFYTKVGPLQSVVSHICIFPNSKRISLSSARTSSKLFVVNLAGSRMIKHDSQTDFLFCKFWRPFQLTHIRKKV
jgi:hypothetical protein